MPIVDTGRWAGATTGIIDEQGYAQERRTMSAAQRPGILFVREAGLERFAER